MKELFGFPAPETQAEYCELCNDCGFDEYCPCETYYKADEETRKKMREAIDERTRQQED